MVAPTGLCKGGTGPKLPAQDKLRVSKKLFHQPRNTCLSFEQTTHDYEMGLLPQQVLLDG